MVDAGPTVVEAGPARGLLAGIRLDLDTAGRALPLGKLLIPLAALVIGAGIGWLRPGYSSFYGESLAVIVALVAVGSFGRPTAALVTIAFAVADMAHFLTIPDSTTGAQLSQATTIGRIVTEGVLWLAVVVVPSASRRVESIAEDRLGDGISGRVTGAALGAVAAGVGIYLWANVMPYLVRPAYKFSPPPATLRPQQEPELLALAAAAAFFAVTVLLRRRVARGAELGPFVSLPSRGLPGLVVRVIAYAVAIGLLIGIIGGPTDALILAAGFVAAEVLAWLAARPAVRSLVRSVPRAILTVGGLALVLAVALAVGSVAQAAWPKGLDSSPFLPIILALACTFPVARLVLVLQSAGSAGDRTFPVPPAVVAALGFLLVVVLVFPATTLADNCANLGDCGFSQRFLLVISGFAAFFGAGAGAASGGGGGSGGDSGGGGGGSRGGGGGPKPNRPPTPPPPPPNDEY